MSSRTLLSLTMRKAEREGDAMAIMAIRIIMVVFFFNASGNKSNYSPTLMKNIVDYLGASSLTRRRMDVMVTSNLRGKVGSNIHQDKLNEHFVKQVKDIFKDFQRCLSDELVSVAVAASNPIRIIKEHTLEVLDRCELKTGGQHAHNTFSKKDEEITRKMMMKWAPFKVRKQGSGLKFQQKTITMWERVNSDNFASFVITKSALYDIYRTP